MLVEDEALIRDMVETALHEGGFETAIATNGEEAIALLKSNQSAYRALITDIHLSGEMTGWDVARTAREIDPTFPVVYMTGAAAEEWASQGVPHSIMLQKPFAPAQVVTAVSQLLNTPPGS
jgi:CheY-like chemotaxis protein